MNHAAPALLAVILPFFNFLSEGGFMQNPPADASQNQIVACDQPVFGKSILTNTYQAAGDTAVGDFNNDGRLDIAVQYGSQNTLVVQNGLGNGRFEAPRIIDSNSTSFYLIAGDFNNDGKIDLLTPARIYYGDGAGNFPQSHLLLLGSNALWFSSADLNGDDKLDLVGWVFSNSTLEVYYGDGTGGFGSQVQVSIPNNFVSGFELADVNNDGLADILTSLSNTNGVGVIYGGVNGLQTPVVVPISGAGTVSIVAAGDVDGDGDKDIYTYGLVSGNSPFTALLKNNGNGTFTAQPRVPDSAGDLSRLSLIDVNGDGKLDVVGNIAKGLFSIRLGDNSGAFQETKLAPGISGQIKLFYEDFTGDGIRDFGISSSSVSSFAVFPNDGTGNIGVDQTSVDDNVINDTAIADFNEDGKTDVVTGSDSMKIWVAFGNGSGLGSLTSVPVSVIPRLILTGDLNNDHHQDILAFLQNGGVSKSAVIYGNGNGTFQPAIETSMPEFRNTGKPVLIDIDNDQYIDLVLPLSTNTTRVGIYQNSAQGSFIFRNQINVDNLVGSVTAGDYNQDGKTDLAILSFAAHIYLGTGTYTFTPLSSFPIGQANSHIYTTDFNGDGIPDLAATSAPTGSNGSNGKVDILMGVGKGGFGAPAEYVVGKSPKSMIAADFDGDGNMDLAVANQGTFSANDDRIAILYGNGQGLFPRIVNSIAGVAPRGLETADFDGDGKPDLVTSDYGVGQISLARNSCLPAPAANFPTIGTSADVSVTEGDASDTQLSVTVSLSAPSTRPVRVKYYTAPFSDIAARLAESELLEAGGSRDYLPAAGELVFQPGQTTKTVSLTVKGDAVDEYDEKFAFYLTNALNGVISNNRTIVTIVDNDGPPALSIGNLSQAEGDSGTTPFNLPVTLSAASGKPIFVQYLTGGGTATAGQDYVRGQGTLTIPAGQTQAVLPVTVVGDQTVEQDETFLVDLSDPLNATLANTRGSATILNDDIGGTVQFSSAAFTTNDSNNGVQISLTRTGGAGGGVSIRFRTQAGTAIPGQDYTEVETTVVFGPGDTARSVFVPVIVDQLDEPDETVNLILDNPVGLTLGTPSTAVLTIQDLEDQPNLSIADASVIERDTGTATMQFYLRLSRPSQRPVSVSFATADQTATAGVDYLAAAGIFTIPPGVTRKALSVTVLGDFQYEQDETFFVNLTNPVNAALTDNQAVGRILNDEINAASQTALISINRTGNGSGNSDSLEPSISSDGRIIAFESYAYDLAETDTNNTRDIYVRNTRTGETRLVSINQAGTDSGNCNSLKPVVSGSGRFVAFNSCASTLTSSSTQLSTTSVYLRDLQTNQTRIVSVDANGAAVNGDVAAISDDGRYVVYQSRDQNVTGIPDTLSFNDIFVRDMQTGVTRMATVNSAGSGPANADSGNTDFLQRNVRITPDGRYLLFPSSATNLVAATSAGGVNLFVRDLQNQVTVPVSGNANNSQLVGADALGCLSSDGRYAVFSTANGTLVGNDPNNNSDVFRRDLSNNSVTLVSVNAAGTTSGNGGSAAPFCSADGRFVSFESTAGDLSPVADTNTVPDIYWRDLDSGTTKLVSVNSAGTNGGDQFSSTRGISADGQIVFFMSAAGNLLSDPIDNNVNFDLYIRDVPANTTKAVSVNEAGTTVGNQPTTRGAIAAGGNVVTFASGATNLVANDTNGLGGDIFAFTKDLPPTPLVDFDGDGKTDLSVFRPADSVWYISESSNGNYRQQQFGLSQDVTVPADYDGDGKTDIAVFRNGTWYLLFSRNNSFSAVAFGQSGDVPAPADYDGDRKADLAVFSQGVWRIRESSDLNVRAQQFGLAGDIPVAADYDGDHRADIAVFRAGIWYVFQSLDYGVRIEQFGIAADKPVPGDYDGDGKTDFAVFRPASGGWYVHLSHDGSYITTQFGISTDVPLRGDFDGDGKADIAVFRDGTWYITQSSDQFVRINQFGIANDRPLAQ
ncbi:MAG: VCBS repeat-containing protein [Acidobacteria bacterium]|nr:VCBS repeat-containing protein [Acidobacteriota bacterium]